MKGLVKLREEVHNRVLNIRTIENIIHRPKFTRLWSDSTETEKKDVVEIIKVGDRRKLHKWIADHPSLDLGEKPLAKLRKIGQKLGVKYYARLSHSELLAAIMKKENEYAQVQD